MMSASNQDDSAEARPPLMIVGIPRSGTTWTYRILECESSLFPMIEPDNEAHSGPAISAKRRTGRFPVLAPGERDDAYRLLWSWALQGAPTNRRLRRASDMIRRARPSTRRRFLERRPSLRMSVAGTLARNPPEGPNPGVGDRRLLIKTVHAPLAIEWLASEFEIDVLAIFRSPASILASWISLDYNDQYAPFCQIPSVQRLAEGLGVPQPGPDHLEQMIWQICLLTTALEQAAARHPHWIVRHHEQLCRDPNQEFRQLHTELDLQWSAQAESELEERNHPGKGFRVRRVTADLPDNWKQRLTSHQVAELQRVMTWFPLKSWSPDDFVMDDQ
jgi:Sulfotransferase family